MENYADLMFHEAIQDLQRADGSHAQFQKMYPHRTQDALSADDIAFIQSRESFYIASTTPDGWPYVQHRGGPAGFLRVSGPNRLLCGDFKGNRQFITMGNLQRDTRVSLFFMDYLNQARLKVQGHATLVPLSEADEAVALSLRTEQPAPERVLQIDVIAMDWNCPKYIPRLYSEAAIRQVVGGQIAQLQAENAALKARLAELEGK